MAVLFTMDQGLVDQLFADFISEVRAALRNEGIKLWVSVGVDDDSEHGGTHLGPGVCDLHGSSRTPYEMKRTDFHWRRLGGWGWVRDALHGGFTQHYHGGLTGHPGLSWAATRQQAAYLAGYNGLGPSKDFRSAPDYGPRDFINVRWHGLDSIKSPSGILPGFTHRVVHAPVNDPLNVRTGPGTGYEKITTVTDGARATLVSTSGNWAKVVFEGGTVGWVYNAYITRIG